VRGLADAGGMVVDQVALEVADLVVVEDDLAELADAGVDAVHDLARLDLALDEGAAGLDALQGLGRQRNGLAVARDAGQVLDGQVAAVQHDRHGSPSGKRTVRKHPSKVQPSGELVQPPAPV